MRSVLSAFEREVAKFEARAAALSPQALADPVRDTDERAAMTLLVSGSLEFFLQEVTRVYVDEVSSRRAPFDALPPIMRYVHFDGGGRHLMKAAKADMGRIKAGLQFDFKKAQEICQRLHSTGLPAYVLVWEGFASTDSNANPETIKTIMNRLDIDKPWETLERSIPGSAHPLPPGPARANKLNADLRDFRDARNRCAHGAANAAAPGWSTLLEYFASAKAVAAGLVQSLEARISTMPS